MAAISLLRRVLDRIVLLLVEVERRPGRAHVVWHRRGRADDAALGSYLAVQRSVTVPFRLALLILPIFLALIAGETESLEIIKL